MGLIYTYIRALSIVHRLGLDPKLLTQVLNISSGRTWASEVYSPCPGVMENVPSSKNYEGGFGTALMKKVPYVLSLLNHKCIVNIIIVSILYV